MKNQLVFLSFYLVTRIKKQQIFEPADPYLDEDGLLHIPDIQTVVQFLYRPPEAGSPQLNRPLWKNSNYSENLLEADHKKQAAGVSFAENIACIVSKYFYDIVFVKLERHFLFSVQMFVLLYLCRHTTLILLKEYKV